MCRDEIKECIRQELFDLIIWVDASKRLPLESADSFNIDQSCKGLSPFFIANPCIFIIKLLPLQYETEYQTNS